MLTWIGDTFVDFTDGEIRHVFLRGDVSPLGYRYMARLVQATRPPPTLETYDSVWADVRKVWDGTSPEIKGFLLILEQKGPHDVSHEKVYNGMERHADLCRSPGR